MRKQHGYTIVEIVLVTLFLLGIPGWIWNLVKIAHTCCALDGMLVLRVVGIFVAPIGAVIGYF